MPLLADVYSINSSLTNFQPRRSSQIHEGSSKKPQVTPRNMAFNNRASCPITWILFELAAVVPSKLKVDLCCICIPLLFKCRYQDQGSAQRGSLESQVVDIQAKDPLASQEFPYIRVTTTSKFKNLDVLSVDRVPCWDIAGTSLPLPCAFGSSFQLSEPEKAHLKLGCRFKTTFGFELRACVSISPSLAVPWHPKPWTSSVVHVGMISVFQSV